MTFQCPHCKQPMERPTLDAALSGVHLTPQERMIADLLWKRRGKSVRPDSIAFHIWQLRTAPADPGNVVSIYIRKLRQKMPHHIQLHTDYGAGYRLELVEDQGRKPA